jgi:hypothetical protein
MASERTYVMLPALLAWMREHINEHGRLTVVPTAEGNSRMLCACGSSIVIEEPHITQQVIDRPHVNASGQRYMRPNPNTTAPADTTWRPDGAIVQAFAAAVATVYRSCRRCKVVDSYTDTEPHMACPRCGNPDYLPTAKRDYTDADLPMGVFDDASWFDKGYSNAAPPARLETTLPNGRPRCGTSLNGVQCWGEYAHESSMNPTPHTFTAPLRLTLADGDDTSRFKC